MFDTRTIAFALRDLVPGTDLDAGQHPGVGTAVWLLATDVQAIHDTLVADGHPSSRSRWTARSGAPTPSPTPTATT